MMINKKGESLVGIIVGVFILSFVLLGIGNLIGNSRESMSNFDKQMDIDILSKNTSKIISNLDLSTLSDGDIFYINKNITNKQFDIYIGEHNREYKYINNSGKRVIDPINYKGKVYERILQAKKLNINGEEKTAVKVLIKKLTQ